MSNPTVEKILGKWDTRRAVYEDARAASPELKMIAVHRWFTRKSIPVAHWDALIRGAKKRGFSLSLQALVDAHTGDSEQVGHTSEVVNDGLTFQGGASADRDTAA